MKLLADENLDNTIIRGFLRRNPSIDVLTFPFELDGDTSLSNTYGHSTFTA